MSTAVRESERPPTLVGFANAEGSTVVVGLANSVAEGVERLLGAPVERTVVNPSYTATGAHSRVEVIDDRLEMRAQGGPRGPSPRPSPRDVGKHLRAYWSLSTR